MKKIILSLTLAWVALNANAQTLTLTSGTATISGTNRTSGYPLNSNDLAAAITLTADCTFSVAGNVTLTGSISGGFAFTVDGAGTLTTSGLHTYTGVTTIAGTCTLLYTTQLPAGTYNILSNAILAVNATAAITQTNNITLTGAGTFAKRGTAQYTAQAGTINMTGGLVDVQAGTFVAAGISIPNTNKASLNIAAAASFLNTKNGFLTYNFNALTGAGTIPNPANTFFLTLGTNNGTGEFSGVIGGGTNTGELDITKLGTGTQTFSGINTYTPNYNGLYATGGTLVVTGSIPKIFLENDAVLTGSGSVGDVVFYSTNNIVRPSAGASLTTGNFNGRLNTIYATLKTANDYATNTSTPVKGTGTFEAGKFVFDLNNQLTNYTNKIFYLTSGYTTASAGSVSVINTGGPIVTYTTSTTGGVIAVTITGTCTSVPAAASVDVSGDTGSGNALSTLLSGSTTSTACPLYFNGGTLRLTADLITSRGFTIDANGGTIDLNGRTLTMNGVISGAGNLLITDSSTGTKGSMAINTAASITGNVTVDGGATVSLDVAGTDTDGGVFGRAANLTINKGQVNASHNSFYKMATVFTVAVTINAGGKLYVKDNAAINLKSVTLNGGEIAGGSSSVCTILDISTNVTDNSLISVTYLGMSEGLTIQPNKTLTVSSSVTDFGSFKYGQGTLLLTGNSPSAQPIPIRDGTVVVNGTYSGSITVQGTGAYSTTGATLSGTGTVGAVTLQAGTAVNGFTTGGTLIVPSGTLTTGALTCGVGSHIKVYASAAGLSKVAASSSTGAYSLHVLNPVVQDIAATNVVTGTAEGTLVENTTTRCLVLTNSGRTVELKGVAPTLNALTKSICSGQDFSYKPITTDGTGITDATYYTWQAPALTNLTTTEPANTTGEATISGTGTATFTTTNVGTAGTAVYNVTAYSDNTKACGGNNFTLTLTVNSTPAPTATAATNISASGYTANWNAVANATNYYVDVASDNAFATPIGSYTNTDAGTATQYSIATTTATSYYRVRAKANGCTSGNSNSITATASGNTLSSPTATAATALTPTGFTANWGAVSGATTYQLDVSTNDTFTAMLSGYPNQNTGNVTTFVVSGLTANTTYYYRVRASNGTFISGNSNVVTAKTGTAANTAPAAPTNVTVSNITATGFTLSWTAGTGADGYRIELFTDSNFLLPVSGYNPLDVGTQTSYSLTGLAVGTYYVRVFAYNSAGISSKVANSGGVAVTGITAPTAPVANNATNITANGFTANWTVVSAATSYQLDVATNQSFANMVTGYSNQSVSGTSLAVSGLSANTTYYYRVRAVANNLASANSNIVTAQTAQPALTAPDAPTNLVLSATTNAGFTATWSAGARAAGYKVEVSASSTFSPLLSGYPSDVGTATTKTISGLQAGHTYYVRVQAYNDAGSSAYVTASNPVVTAIEASAKASVYPIPTQGELTLDLSAWTGEVRVQISSLLGTTHIDKTIFGGNAYTLSVSELSAGIYFVTLTNSKQQATVRVVKE